MRKMIHKYVTTCKKCQIIHFQKPNYIHVHQEIAKTPQDHLSIDLIGPYSTTIRRQHKYSHSNLQSHRLPYDNHIPDKNTSTIAVYLLLEIFLKFVFPRILHSNNGTKFKLKLIKQLT